ncbi:MAG: type IV pilus modification protein PilV [Moraxella sp.]|jgi:type IV pilus assembly protein PilV
MQSQQGVGLIEVLVALMLLAIAVLGFTAMQMTAVKATDESLMRTRALTVMRGAAEMMRANAEGIPAFKTAINGTATTVTNTDTSNVAITKDSCISGGTPASCTIKQLAVKDALTVKQYATDNELSVGMATCPNTRTTVTNADNTTTTTTSAGQDRQCLIASWGDTDPIFLDDAVATDTTKDKPCADEDGIYSNGVQCFIMEAY